jgi:hypothetical protein
MCGFAVMAAAGLLHTAKSTTRSGRAAAGMVAARCALPARERSLFWQKKAACSTSKWIYRIQNTVVLT